jgi:hypothetical protein
MIRDNTIQYNTIQYNTIQYNSTVHTTVNIRKHALRFTVLYVKLYRELFKVSPTYLPMESKMLSSFRILTSSSRWKGDN